MERATITALTDDGDGLAQTTAGVVCVSGVLLGEEVEVAVESSLVRRESPAPARLLRVVVPSSERVTPRCRHADRCGGCSWQHVAYSEQLRLKREYCRHLLVEALGTDAPTVHATVASPHLDDEAPWGYRQKVHFVVGVRDGAPVLGHFVKRSDEILPVSECPVHAPDGNRLAFALRRELEVTKIPPATADLRRGTVRHVVVRVGANTPDRTLTVVTRCVDARVAPAAERALSAVGLPATSLALNLHAGPDSYLFGLTTRLVRGAPRLREEVRGLVYLLSPTAFFQTNVSAAALLVDLVTAAVPTSDAVVADLYAGVGLFSLPLAKRGHRVIAIEENPQAVADGVASRRLNRIDEQRCRFLRGRVGEMLARGVSPRPEVVVMDPPRSGCEPRVLETVCGSLKPRRIVYVSCHPAALANDLRAARRFGYRATQVTPVDMFPHTAHVEAVAVIEPSETPRRRRPRA